MLGKFKFSFLNPSSYLSVFGLGEFRDSFQAVEFLNRSCFIIRIDHFIGFPEEDGFDFNVNWVALCVANGEKIQLDAKDPLSIALSEAMPGVDAEHYVQIVDGEVKLIALSLLPEGETIYIEIRSQGDAVSISDVRRELQATMRIERTGGTTQIVNS